MFRRLLPDAPLRGGSRARAIVAGAVAVSTLGVTVLVGAPANADPITTSPSTTTDACSFAGTQPTNPYVNIQGTQGWQTNWTVDDDGAIVEVNGRDTVKEEWLQGVTLNWGELESLSLGSVGYDFTWDFNCVRRATEQNGDVVQRTVTKNTGNGLPVTVTNETRFYAAGDIVRRSYTIQNTSSSALPADASIVAGHDLGTDDDTYSFGVNANGMVTTDIDGEAPLMLSVWGNATTDNRGNLFVSDPTQPSFGEAADRSTWVLGSTKKLPTKYVEGLSPKPVNWTSTTAAALDDSSATGTFDTKYSIGALAPGATVTVAEFFRVQYFDDPDWADDDLADGTVGKAYSDGFTGPAGKTYTYKIVEGELQSGLALNQDGTLTGTPTAGGERDITVWATSGKTIHIADEEFQIEKPDWADDEIGDDDGALRVGVPVTDAVKGPEIAGATWQYEVAEGALPDGVVLDKSTGAVTGTPKEAADWWSAEITAKSGTYEFSTEVGGWVKHALPLWSDTETATGYVGVEYSDEVVAEHAVAYRLVEGEGELPDGLELHEDGTLTGTPTEEGTFTYTVEAGNGEYPKNGRSDGFGETAEHEITTVIEGAAVGLTLEANKGDVAAGADVSIGAAGLKPGSEYTLEMHSDPIVLDRGVIGEDGMLAKTVALPAGTPSGAHELVLTGIAPNGDVLVAKAWFSVDADGKIVAVSYTGPLDNPIVAALASTGANPAGLLGLVALLMGAGAALFFVNRRRRAHGAV